MFREVNLVLHQLIQVCFEILHNHTNLRKVIFLNLFQTFPHQQLSILRANNVKHSRHKAILVIWKIQLIKFIELSHELQLSE